MADTTIRTTMSKREFIRSCLVGAGAVSLVMGRTEAAAAFGRRLAALGLDSGGPGKWSKEAMFYVRSGAKLRCQKCPNECVLDEGGTGFCRSRVNYSGKMYSIAYGNPCAVHIDPIEKKPLFHFLPTSRAFSIAVAGCNFRCLNCQNWEISQVSPNETNNANLMPDAVVDQCSRNRCESIAYTYSEPTSFYEYAYDTAKLARARGIRNVWKSNGYINELPLRTLCKYLDAANIDLKSFDDSIYSRLSSGKLAPVLRTLKVFRDEGVWLEITNLVIPGWTDDFDMIRRMTDWLCANGLSDSPLHFSRFVPLYKLTQLPTTPVSTLEKARDLARGSGMKYVYIGNVPGHQAENTYCPKCAKLLVERRGFSILENNIAAGQCKFCGERISGVWG